MTISDSYQLAHQLIDAAHAAHSKTAPNGRPAELVYAEHLERWVTRLIPGASPLLRLGTRCQHLERWSVPRDTFPLGKPGYHAWRESLYRKQADRAQELLLIAGVPLPPNATLIFEIELLKISRSTTWPKPCGFSP